MALSVILTSAALCGCNKAGGADRAEAAHEREPLTIWTATDIHYLSPELTDDGELFRKVIADGDAKQIRMRLCLRVISLLTVKF